MRVITVAPPVSELLLAGICDTYSRINKGITPGPYLLYASKNFYPDYPKYFSLSGIHAANKHLRNMSVGNFGFNIFHHKCIVGVIICDFISHMPFSNWCDRRYNIHAHFKCPYRFAHPFPYKPPEGKRLVSSVFNFDPNRLAKTDNTAAQTYRLEWNKPRAKFAPKRSRPRKFNF